MLQKLEEIAERFMQLQEQMSDPEVISDIKRFAKLNKQYRELEGVVMVYEKYKGILEGIGDAREMIEDGDHEMKAMAREELDELENQRQVLEEEIKVILMPKDPEDSKDVIIEIRSGTGGDEASIFAGDLYRMYMKFFERNGWKVTAISVNEGTVGGFNKIVLEVDGSGVYGKMKFESGAHRVQRVPKTESQGRVHTSAATVAVMPKFEMEDIDVNKADLRVDTFRASGAGGQHVNKTESGVRFTHIPSGIAAESTDSRSQIKNREIALQRLYAKIHEVRKQAFENEAASRRRSLVGSGDRSDKIRTYNFPQNRMTDHRIGLTLYCLDKIIQGQIDEIIEALQVAENAEKMKSEV